MGINPLRAFLSRDNSEKVKKQGDGVKNAAEAFQAEIRPFGELPLRIKNQI